MGVNVDQFSVSTQNMALGVDDDNMTGSVLSIGNQISDALSEETDLTFFYKERFSRSTSCHISKKVSSPIRVTVPGDRVEEGM